MSPRREGGGSRYLYDSFDATAARVEANERVAEERWTALEARLQQMERVLERLEKRIWLAAYGVAGFVLAEAVQVVLTRLGK
ncbi:hypothetical protein FGG78_40530 [Thioclava sp. BHET1]|nr:hypothetical protein FGG78_40530 [Thioclava sp. BHET1]